MVIDGKGYLFEGRKDCKGNYGVMESYKLDYSYKDGKQQVRLVCCLDSSGHILKPAINNLSAGFMPLNDGSGADKEQVVSKFVASNKPCFGKLGDFTLIVYATLIFGEDGSLESDNLKFYSPRTIATYRFKEDEVPAFVCDIVSDKKGLNTCTLGKALIEGYRKNFLSALTRENTSSRKNYITSRWGVA